MMVTSMNGATMDEFHLAACADVALDRWNAGDGAGAVDDLLAHPGAGAVTAVAMLMGYLCIVIRRRCARWSRFWSHAAPTSRYRLRIRTLLGRSGVGSADRSARTGRWTS